MVPIDCITFHFIFSQLSSRLMIFGWQKQASCGWQLYLFTLYYPQYNLAAKSNYLTFFSKINCFDGIIKITDTLHTINKAINARNITKPKSNHSQVTVHLGLIHHLVMHVCHIQIPSLIFSAYRQSFLSHWHPAKLLQLLMTGRNIFFLTVHENATLLDSLTCPTHCLQGNVSYYSHNVSRHKRITDFIILFSSP